ncbi:hypothetical protein Fmac_027434 [Flemingia macrophylla]|uniref:CASP-like protein n=1 Tax=Flemingia macrophylla TaxID=520843 RepID=A0ABD1LHN7_9FABA
MDFILRLGAIAAALGAAATMGTSDQTLPFFTQFFQFEASYDSFTTFQYVFLTLATASGASAAAVVYLAHNGNQDSNWLAICNQFGDLCAQTSSAVVASLVAVVVLVLLVVMSSLALGKR